MTLCPCLCPRCPSPNPWRPIPMLRHLDPDSQRPNPRSLFLCLDPRHEELGAQRPMPKSPELELRSPTLGPSGLGSQRLSSGPRCPSQCYQGHSLSSMRPGLKPQCQYWDLLCPNSSPSRPKPKTSVLTLGSIEAGPMTLALKPRFIEAKSGTILSVPRSSKLHPYPSKPSSRPLGGLGP